MPRRPRTVIPGVAHHITQRGNNRECVFRSTGDRKKYLDLLAKYASTYRIRLLGYCLMNNHVHLVAIPEHEHSLSRTLKHAHSDYAVWWNRREGRTGHLWQGRFFSCPLDNQHLPTALRYVDENPVRAGLVRGACDWPWSSAQAHCSPHTSDSTLDPRWTEYMDAWSYSEWRDILIAGTLRHEDEWNELRRATSAGEPLGSQRFMQTLEAETGHKLRVLPRGRPRKPENSSVPFFV